VILTPLHNRNAKSGGLPERHLAHQSWPPIQWGAGVVVCLDSGARCRQLYDLHINTITYTLFFYSRLSVSKSIFMFPWVIIFYCLLWRPLGNCPVCPPPLNPALIRRLQSRNRIMQFLVTWSLRQNNFSSCYTHTITRRRPWR